MCLPILDETIGVTLIMTKGKKLTVGVIAASLMATTACTTNPETGNRGTIEPTRTYQSGQTCREYQHTVYVGGRAEQARGNACRQPDGTWRIVS